jgi:hypothetical protein
VIIIVYVDDILVTGNDTVRMELVRKSLSQEYSMTDLGQLTYYIEVEYAKHPKKIVLTQRAYIEKTLRELGLAKAKPIATPMPEGLRLEIDMKEEIAGELVFEELIPPTPYRQLVGTIRQMVHTRPNVMFASRVVSRYLQTPQCSHMKAAEHIMQYLKGTSQWGILCRNGETTKLKGFCDADYGGDKDDYMSTNGYTFYLRTTPISWSNKKQDEVAMSSLESEYVAMAEVAKEGIWIQNLLRELSFMENEQLELYCDNQSSMKMAENPVGHHKTKHMNLRHHYIRNQVLKGEVNLVYTPTGEQVADIFTKALGHTKFEYFRSTLGLINLRELPPSYLTQL